MPDWVSSLPAVNASLNALATVLLLAGYFFIRRGKIIAHRNTMLSSFVVSVVFLCCYLVYHSYHLTKTFPPISGVREVYWVILATHVVLAAAVPFLAVATIWLALVKGDFARHKRIARITFPIWLYVSVTGVIIYGMLYHLAPALTKSN